MALWSVSSGTYFVIFYVLSFLFLFIFSELKEFQRDAWVAQWLSICLWLRA